MEIVATFDAMGLKDELLRGLYADGFEKPSAIQQRAIMPILKGRDTIAQAQSGTARRPSSAPASCRRARRCQGRRQAAGVASARRRSGSGSAPEK